MKAKCVKLKPVVRVYVLTKSRSAIVRVELRVVKIKRAKEIRRGIQ